MKTKHFIFLSILFVVATGSLLIPLSKIPFGFLFNSIAFFFVLSLIGLFFFIGFYLIKLKKWFLVPGIASILVSALVLCVLLIFQLDYNYLLGHSSNKKISYENWEEDLNVLTTKMKEIHPDLFSMVDQQVFEKEVNVLRRNLPFYDENKIRAEFNRIIALPNDAHTLPNIQSFNLDWHFYPIDLYCFADGVYVINAGRGKKHLIGSKLIKIGGYSIDSVRKRLGRYLASENEQHRKNRISVVLIEEWLRAEGIISNSREVVFDIQDGQGQVFQEKMTPIHYLPYFYWTILRKVDNDAHTVVTNNRKENYAFEYRPDSKVMHFYFNACVESKKEPVNAFIKRMEESIDNCSIDKFIVDLRNNDGGAVHLLHPFLKFIKENKKINQEGKLFVLIGRKSFSAAVLFASMLERNTNAVFVGEPTGQAPYQRGAGFPKLIQLPHSGMQFYISRAFLHASFLMDKRLALLPDIAFEYSVEDFLQNKDPLLSFVLNYKRKEKLLHSCETDLDITGRYLFSEDQILSVFKEGEEYRLRISDYFDNSLQETNTLLKCIARDECISTINKFKLKFISKSNKEVDSLIVIWDKERKKIPKLKADFKLPIEYFSSENLDQALEIALTNKQYFIKRGRIAENYFNRLGYGYLNKKSFGAAIKIFELNVALFPNSSNVYDSLGDAYMKSGKNAEAIKNYRESLAINANNAHAKNKLELLTK